MWSWVILQQQCLQRHWDGVGTSRTPPSWYPQPNMVLRDASTDRDPRTKCTVVDRALDWKEQVSCALYGSLFSGSCVPFQSISLFLPPVEVPFLWLCWVSAAAWAFSSCSERGLLCSCSALASRCRGLSCCRVQALDRRPSSCHPPRLGYSTACGIFPEWGLNPCGRRILYHWATRDALHSTSSRKIPSHCSKPCLVRESQRARKFVNQQNWSTTGDWNRI